MNLRKLTKHAVRIKDERFERLDGSPDFLPEDDDYELCTSSSKDTDDDIAEDDDF